jgi:hypothetical protein
MMIVLGVITGFAAGIIATVAIASLMTLRYRGPYHR